MTDFRPMKPNKEFEWPRWIFCYRDPTEKDEFSFEVIWVSTDTVSQSSRVFQGNNGKWAFIGNFHPEPPRNLEVLNDPS